MSEDFNWEQAEEAVARARATFADNAPNAEEAERRNRADQENRLLAFKERIKREIHRLQREAWEEHVPANNDLEHELLIFFGEIDGCMDSLPTNEAIEWMINNIGALERLHAQTAEERQNALRKLVAIRGGADYTADYFEATAAPVPTEGATEGEDTAPPVPTDEDEEEDQLEELLRRLARANYRLKEEVVEPGYSRHSGLERELRTFCDVLVHNLRKIPPRLALVWLGAHLGSIEALRARTERERQHTLLTLRGIRGSLYYTVAHILDDELPAPTAREYDEDEDGDEEIPWDEDDDEEEEEFHQAATREIVAAYRNTAVCIRDNLIARLRSAAHHLGRQAAEHSPDPWRRGLNDDIGRFMGWVEVVLRGINPIEAQEWLQSNVEEFESLQATTPRDYDQAGQVLSGMSDRLVGLLYEIAREK